MARAKVAISLDESGNRFTHEVFTGTTQLGTAEADNCLNWASESSGKDGITGRAWRAGSGWTTSGSPSQCSSPNHLYCFSNQIVLGWDNFETGDFRRWSSVVGAP